MPAAYRIGRHRGKCVIVYTDETGCRRRVSLGTGEKGAAERLAPAVWAELSRPTGETVTGLWAAYTTDLGDRAIVPRLGHSLKALQPVFGDLPASDIMIGHCRAHTAARRDAGVSDGTIHTELGHLRMMLKWAAKNRYLAAAPEIERPAKPRSKTPHLTPEEIDRLLAACTLPHVRLFVLLAYHTGGRRAALLELTWDRVDFEAGRIDLRNPEINRPHKGRAVVPMTGTLRAALTVAREGALSDYVIEWGGQPISNPRRAIAAAAKRAGLSHVSPHMFRHSTAVQMVRHNRPMKEVAEFLGHSNVSMVEQVYSRYRSDYLQAASATLEFRENGTTVPGLETANVG